MRPTTHSVPRILLHSPTPPQPGSKNRNQPQPQSRCQDTRAPSTDTVPRTRAGTQPTPTRRTNDLAAAIRCEKGALTLHCTVRRPHQRQRQHGHTVSTWCPPGGSCSVTGTGNFGFSLPGKQGDIGFMPRYVSLFLRAKTGFTGERELYLESVVLLGEYNEQWSSRYEDAHDLPRTTTTTTTTRPSWTLHLHFESTIPAEN